MKKINITLFFVLLFNHYGLAQIFPVPDGKYGTFSEKKKEIKQCNSSASSGIKQFKFSTSNRRYKFQIAFWNECYTNGAKVNGSSCSGTCNSGWNKAGRVCFVRANDANRNKLHLGWKYDNNNYNKLKLSMYFHETYNSNLDYCFVSHYISTKPTNSYINVDMFIGLEVIALIVDNKAIGIRKPGWIPKKYNSFIKRTFYFGEKSPPKECVAPHNLACKFINESYDRRNYLGAFNNCDVMIWNITTFKSDDKEVFFAKKELYGSIKNPLDVQYHSSHPNKIKQQCIIESGADIVFASGEKVFLNKGFHAKQGSHFRAVIDPCILYPSIGVIPTTATFIVNTGYEVCYEEIYNADSYTYSLYNKDDELVYSNSGGIYSNNLCFNIGYIWPGTYKAYLVLSNNCGKVLELPPHKIGFYSEKSSEEIVKDTLKIEKSNDDYMNNLLYFNIFPNPTHTGLFTLRFNDGVSESYSVEVRNTTGIAVFSRDNVRDNAIAVDIRNEPKGLYIVKVTAGDKVYTEKVIVQ